MNRLAKIKNGIVSNVILGESFPDYISCPNNVGKGWEYSEGVFTAPNPKLDEANEPTSIDVNIERDRRLRETFVFDGTSFDFDANSKANISGASLLAFMAISQGAPKGFLRWADSENDFVWIATDNSLIPMDAHTVVKFGQEAAAHESRFIKAARLIKDSSPIPENYSDDKYWPNS